MAQNIGEILRKTREEKGLTQKQLAEKTGLSLNTIYNAEKVTATCHLDTYRKICAVLGLKLSDIIEL